MPATAMEGTFLSWLASGKARLTILDRSHHAGIQAAVECEHIHIVQ